MRSSPEEFLLFSNKAKQSSKLIRVSGSASRVIAVVLNGRVVAASLKSFTVAGRGCEMTFDISGANFDFATPEEIAAGRTPSDVPFTEFWEIDLGDSDLLVVVELRGSLDKT
jgi:hypothetical protein